MIKDTISEIFVDVWPMLLIFSVVLISLRLTYIFLLKKEFILYKELLSLFFIMYILLLFHVVTFQDVAASSNFTLFKEIFRYEFGSRLFFKNVVGNMVMFIPYGFFSSQLLKIKKPYIILILSFITSLTIEITQMYLGRVFDVDDILLNILGGTLGYLLYLLSFKVQEKLPKFLKNEIFYNILMIVLISLAVLYLTNMISFGGIYE
ncbi:MAG: VanZ family protein [Bacilli bacterium]|nr:VanZ family protein [Bacilli bacterium]